LLLNNKIVLKLFTKMFKLTRIFQKDNYKTDKMGSYFPVYLEKFNNLKDRRLKLLELGIYKGESLKLWRDYFPNSEVIGLDQNSIELDNNDRIIMYKGLQQDKKLLTSISERHAPDGFDIIIDDASHIGQYTKESFMILFDQYLKSKGVYVIEDWGTGYWGTWPDGEKYDPELATQGLTSHQAGMVGFVKQIIDLLAAADITHPTFGDKSVKLVPRIESVHFYPGLCFINKK